jgi:GntR family transcriptional regulator
MDQITRAHPTEHAPANGETERLIAAIRDVVGAERGTPRYERIADAIECSIESGALSPGALLPQEPELAAALGTSRQTLRRAFDVLARKGLIARRRGIGTFVRRPDLEQPLGQLSSFLQTLALSGEPPAVQLIGARRALDRPVSRILAGDDDQLVFEITRLFSVGGEPIVLETIFLPAFLADVLPIEALGSAVIDQLLLERAGIRVDRGEESLRLTHVDRTEAALLAIRTREPAFLIERTAYAGDDAVEVRRSIVRGDRARFTIALEGALLNPEAHAASEKRD